MKGFGVDEFVEDPMRPGFDPYGIAAVYPWLLEQLNPPERARIERVAEDSPGLCVLPRST